MEIRVIGAGALGLGAALALAEDGHQVTVVEQQQPASGATAKAAGVVSTMTWDDLEYQLIAETRGMIGELISMAAGIEPAARGAWRPLDSITIAKGENVAALDAIQDRLERFSEEPERMDHRQAAAAFPGVRFEPGEEVLVAMEDGVLDASAFATALKVRLDQEGVEVVTDQRVEAADLEAMPTVVAGGAWTGPLLADAGITLPCAAFRTQLAALQMPAADLPVVHDTVHGFYARPESDGTLWAGDGTVLEPHDPEQYNEAGDPEFIESTAQRVVQRFDAGADAHMRTSWAGLCVATPDRHALCGPVPDHDDLWVLTGDNGFGLMRSLALGERLAEAVDGDVDARLDPGRFGPRVGSDFEMQEGFAF